MGSVNIRLSDLSIKPCTGCEGCMKRRLRGEVSECVLTGDDYRWLANQIKDSDALLVGAPIYHDIPSGNLIVTLNRGLGFGAPSQRTKVCASISLGGSDWIDFSEPMMDMALRNFAENAEIVDKMTWGDHPAPNMAMIDDELLARARKVGTRLAKAYLGETEGYQGDSGICPECHCNLLEPVDGITVMCPFCGSSGDVAVENGKMVIHWDEASIENSRFSTAGRAKHRADIGGWHKWIAERKDVVAARRDRYTKFDPLRIPE